MSEWSFPIDSHNQPRLGANEEVPFDIVPFFHIPSPLSSNHGFWIQQSYIELGRGKLEPSGFLGFYVHFRSRPGPGWGKDFLPEYVCLSVLSQFHILLSNAVAVQKNMKLFRWFISFPKFEHWESSGGKYDIKIPPNELYMVSWILQQLWNPPMVQEWELCSSWLALVCENRPTVFHTVHDIYNNYIFHNFLLDDLLFAAHRMTQGIH